MKFNELSQVEVDILTGEMFIVRTDLIEDAGLSTSPQVLTFVANWVYVCDTMTCKSGRECTQN